MTTPISTSGAIHLWVASLENDVKEKTRLQLTADEVKGGVLDICIDSRQPREQLPESLRTLLVEAESRIETAEQENSQPTRFTLDDVLNRVHSSLTELQVAI